MYKVLKDSQKEFVDLSQTACDDIETSVAVGRKFVARLYHPKARFTCDHASTVFGPGNSSSLKP
jgi:hypothetical protein